MSRSYGAILPSSFSMVLPCTLGYSPRPPVSVYGTVRASLLLSLFLAVLRRVRSVRRPPFPNALGLLLPRPTAIHQADRFISRVTTEVQTLRPSSGLFA